MMSTERSTLVWLGPDTISTFYCPTTSIGTRY